LTKNGLLDIVDDGTTNDPVIVAVTFDGGKISRFFSMSLEVLRKWIIVVGIQRQGLICLLTLVVITFKVINIVFLLKSVLQKILNSFIVTSFVNFLLSLGNMK
jgi:hypothetical protein